MESVVCSFEVPRPHGLRYPDNYRSQACKPGPTRGLFPAARPWQRSGWRRRRGNRMGRKCTQAASPASPSRAGSFPPRLPRAHLRCPRPWWGERCRGAGVTSRAPGGRLARGRDTWRERVETAWPPGIVRGDWAWLGRPGVGGRPHWWEAPWRRGRRAEEGAPRNVPEEAGSISARTG